MSYLKEVTVETCSVNVTNKLIDIFSMIFKARLALLQSANKERAQLINWLILSVFLFPKR
jgi:hypothetical protein